MSNDFSSIQILLTPRFKKDLAQLAKRYRSIRKDLEPLIEQLQAGEIVGDRVSNVNYQVFKVRLRNSDIKKGKRAGYRVIYYLKTKDRIILVTIYSKADWSDIQNKVIEEIIKTFES
ncbi:MAG: type II toxin-antitoxin system RelE/ParE family toxin [Cyanobacteria bacterium]|jgi:mRNA-degrading endonuclease RelE of RelBE toxin-antitoxin system|nr:type II toxin-antitoxin system RelE/ParE family toxin [Cyanobacteria bacterium GSL.Bin1]